MIPEGDMSGLLAQAQAMQEQFLNAQQELAEMQVDGSAGGDLVIATVTGAGELVGLEIKPEAVDPALREKARRGIRPTRKGSDGRSDDDRDAAASRDDSDLEETAESHTELLARHLGAEIIAEEDHGA